MLNFKSNIIRLSLTIFLLFFTVELMAGSLLSSQDSIRTRDLSVYLQKLLNDKQGKVNDGFSVPENVSSSRLVKSNQSSPRKGKKLQTVG